MRRLYRERAVLFGRERSLVGVSCRPVQSEGERPVIIFLNSGIVHRIGGNRIYVTLARALAEGGFSSLRFDLAGVGDSLILPNSPFMTSQERSVVDIDGALESLEAAEKLIPNDPQLEARLGQALLSKGRTAEALGHLQTAVATGYDNPNVRRWLALALALNEDYSESQRVLDAVDPDAGGAGEIVAGYLELRRERYPEAELTLRAVANARPGDPAAFSLFWRPFPGDGRATHRSSVENGSGSTPQPIAANRERR